VLFLEIGPAALNLESRAACHTWGMSDDRLYLIDTFAFILSVSAVRIRETSPRGMGVSNA
jgi:hypothetical protein